MILGYIYKDKGNEMYDTKHNEMCGLQVTLRNFKVRRWGKIKIELRPKMYVVFVHLLELFLPMTCCAILNKFQIQNMN